ncbi:MAG: hypothetical protein ACYC69_13275 [Thermodesulfovibrionales bacterium]
MAPNYTIDEDGDTLTFRTNSFRSDQGSVLHSGIYNREFSSMLASMALAGLAYPFLVMLLGQTLLLYACILVIAAGSFPLLRRYVFRDILLSAVFDRSARRAVISQNGLLERRTETVLLSAISRVMVEKKTPVNENPDGVEFVNRISLQHNTVIPGFGDETPLYLLMLRLSDGTDRLLYADCSMEDVLGAYDRIKGFLKIQ